MSQEALITLDLQYSTDEQREDFDKKLKEINWIKIDNLSTAWKTYFDINERKKIITILQNGIAAAKNYSKVNKVYYAIQVGKEKIEINNI